MKKTIFLALSFFCLTSLFVISCKKKKTDDVIITTPTLDCAQSGLVMNATISGSTATLLAAGGAAPYQYSKDGNIFQDANTFVGLNYNTYTFTVKDKNACTTTAVASSAALYDSRNDKTYKTVTISGQIWMSENLNYIPSTGTTSCQSGLADSCTKYGSLYDLTSALVACPDGWHLPNDAEYRTLEKNIGLSDADTASYGNNRGDATSLKVGGSTGFNALMSGSWNGSAYANIGTETFFWTSTAQTGPGTATMRLLKTSNGGIGRNNATATSRFCVRCLKN